MRIQFELVDDGSMDTVIRCPECNESARFNPEGDDRIEQAMEMMAEDQECEPQVFKIAQQNLGWLTKKVDKLVKRANQLDVAPVD